MTRPVERRPARPDRKTGAQLKVAVEPDWGPAMAVLNDRQRAFVLGLYQVRPGHGASVRAARLAGYGTPQSSAETMATIASRLVHGEKIQAALREHDGKVLRASAPRALLALHGMVENPEHKDHARAVGMVLDRVHPVETIHHVKSEHQHVLVATDEVLARIRMIADRVGVGAMPPLIEASARQVTETNGDGDDGA
jgi:phage terminase small subunit